jgi:hypothetical protein
VFASLQTAAGGAEHVTAAQGSLVQASFLQVHAMERDA